ncbi:MAG: hypothetical protein DHS20C10_03050 [marine bacterium B5-7]|nr:MAG: hypothetical protein DHS20C10_03050 [marine bacterium B5-7]
MPLLSTPVAGARPLASLEQIFTHDLSALRFGYLPEERLLAIMAHLEQSHVNDATSIILLLAVSCYCLFEARLVEFFLEAWDFRVPKAVQDRLFKYSAVNTLFSQVTHCLAASESDPQTIARYQQSSKQFAIAALATASDDKQRIYAYRLLAEVRPESQLFLIEHIREMLEAGQGFDLLDVLIYLYANVFPAFPEAESEQVIDERADALFQAYSTFLHYLINATDYYRGINGAKLWTPSDLSNVEKAFKLLFDLMSTYSDARAVDYCQDNEFLLCMRRAEAVYPKAAEEDFYSEKTSGLVGVIEECYGRYRQGQESLSLADNCPIALSPFRNDELYQGLVSRHIQGPEHYSEDCIEHLGRSMLQKTGYHAGCYDTHDMKLQLGRLFLTKMKRSLQPQDTQCLVRPALACASTRLQQSSGGCHEFMAYSDASLIKNGKVAESIADDISRDALAFTNVQHDLLNKMSISFVLSCLTQYVGPLAEHVDEEDVDTAYHADAVSLIRVFNQCGLKPASRKVSVARRLSYFSPDAANSVVYHGGDSSDEESLIEDDCFSDIESLGGNEENDNDESNWPAVLGENGEKGIDFNRFFGQAPRSHVDTPRPSPNASPSKSQPGGSSDPQETPPPSPRKIPRSPSHR